MALFECALLRDNNDLRLAASSLISAAKLPRLGLVLDALGANALTIITPQLQWQSSLLKSLRKWISLELFRALWQPSRPKALQRHRDLVGLWELQIQSARDPNQARLFKEPYVLEQLFGIDYNDVTATL